MIGQPNRQENQVEPEKEVDEKQKGPYILQSEVQKAIKGMYSNCWQKVPLMTQRTS
jgi:hypothetical protein